LDEIVEEEKPGEEIEILSSPTMLSKLILHSLRAPTLHNKRGRYLKCKNWKKADQKLFLPGRYSRRTLSSRNGAQHKE
jgi:hypothetical protein